MAALVSIVHPKYGLIFKSFYGRSQTKRAEDHVQAMKA